MTQDSLKRINTALVSLHRFQQYSPVNDPSALFTRSRLLIRALIAEYNQYPALTYLRIKNYLDNLDEERVHIRTMSLMLVIAKAHHFSDTALEHVLTALNTAQRLTQVASQQTSTNKTHPNWIDKLQSTDLYTDSLRVVLHQQHAVALPKDQFAFTFDWGLVIARYIANAFTQTATSKLIELTTIHQILEQAPRLNRLLLPLITPTSVFWSGCVLHQQETAFFLLYATTSELKVATRADKDSITVSSAAHHMLYTSKLGYSQISFKIWLKTLFVYQQTKQQDKQQMAIPEYPIQRPPNSLLNILRALHKPTSEPSTIASLIGQSRFFSQSLRRSAQQLNRMSIPVTDIKQSIMTHGMERISTLLTEQVLWARLTHSNFPLKQKFEQLAELHRFVAASVAFANKQVLPQQASLLATLQLSFLFTYAPLKTLLHWHEDYSNTNLTGPLIENIDSDVPLNSAVTLAQAWHQPTNIITPLTFFNRGTATPSVHVVIELLKLSLHLSRHWRCGHELSETEYKALAQQYHQLKLSAKQLMTIRQNASESLQCSLN